MIAFPAFAALVALACAAFVGWDALRRPRPERLAWTIAFLVFAVAAGAEVAGSVTGWSPTLARIYYLGGAVLVVGILAIGEVYLLFPGRVPAFVPGVAMLVAALAATVVWSAPVDGSRLATAGWGAIERGPLLIALAASINAGGTAFLVGGTLYSAWKLRGWENGRSRLVGCILIALGTLAVASGGTLTRFGNRQYLYLAMAAGIAIIFAGYLFTRRTVARRTALGADGRGATRPPRIVPLPARRAAAPAASEGIRYIVEALLPLDDAAVAAACRRWSASAVAGDALTREQAHRVWALRLRLPEASRSRFDALPPATQAQLGELLDQVWEASAQADSGERRA